MNSFVSLTFLVACTAILSSCCMGHSKAVRIHNLSGDAVFKQITRSESEKIKRFGHEIFIIPNSATYSYTEDLMPETPHSNRSIKIRDSKGVLWQYTNFDWQNYAGPTYKKWSDPGWTCISKRYRAVLRPDMTINFGGQIITPEIGKIEDNPYY